MFVSWTKSLLDVTVVVALFLLICQTDTLSIFGNIINLKFSGSTELSYNSHDLPVNNLPQIVDQKYFRSSLLKVNIF